MRQGKITELPGQRQFYPFFPKEQFQGLYAQFELLMETGKFNFGSKETLNDIFPNIKPKSVKMILEEGWKHGVLGDNKVVAKW